MKIHALVQTLEHPQTLRPINLKALPFQQLLPDNPKTKSAPHSVGVNITWKFGENPCMDLGCRTLTNFKTKQSLKVLPWQQLSPNPPKTKSALDPLGVNKPENLVKIVHRFRLWNTHKLYAHHHHPDSTGKDYKPSIYGLGLKTGKAYLVPNNLHWSDWGHKNQRFVFLPCIFYYCF